jgi:hypothetical protein
VAAAGGALDSRARERDGSFVFRPGKGASETCMLRTSVANLNRTPRFQLLSARWHSFRGRRSDPGHNVKMADLQDAA